MSQQSPTVGLQRKTDSNRNRYLQRAGTLLNVSKENGTSPISLAEENKTLKDEIQTLKSDLVKKTKKQDRLMNKMKEMEAALSQSANENERYKQILEDKDAELHKLHRNITKPFVEQTAEDNDDQPKSAVVARAPSAEQATAIRIENEKLKMLENENKFLQTRVEDLIGEQEQLMLQIKLQQEDATETKKKRDLEQNQTQTNYEDQIRALTTEQTEAKTQICKLLLSNDQVSKELARQQEEAVKQQEEYINKYDSLWNEKTRIEGLITNHMHQMTEMEERAAGLEIAQSFYYRLQKAIASKHENTAMTWKESVDHCNELIQKVIFDLERLFGTMFQDGMRDLSNREAVVKFVLQLLLEYGKLNLTVNDISDEVVRLVEQKNALFLQTMTKPPVQKKVVSRRR
jgi:predicted  nucleic acid-binding Zn-ribbon protein